MSANAYADARTLLVDSSSVECLISITPVSWQEEDEEEEEDEDEEEVEAEEKEEEGEEKEIQRRWSACSQ